MSKGLIYVFVLKIKFLLMVSTILVKNAFMDVSFEAYD